jgi:hypothetical protein
VLGQLQESMQIVVETKRHFGHHLDNLREMVHELKDEAAIDEQFNSTNPNLCLSTSKILPPKLPEPLGSSAHAEATKEDFKKVDPALGLFLTEPQSQPFLEPSGSFTAPPAKTLATLTPIGVLHARSFDPATKLARLVPMDELYVTVVPEQSLATPLPLLVNSNHKAQLSFNDKSPALDLVVWKHRWRWKTVVADEDAVVVASAGDIDGGHRMPGMIFPGGSHSSVSMNEGNPLVAVPHPWTPMPFDIPADTSFA